MVKSCPLTTGEVDPVVGQQLAVIDLKPWHKRDLEIRPLPDRYVKALKGAWGRGGGRRKGREEGRNEGWRNQDIHVVCLNLGTQHNRGDN